MQLRRHHASIRRQCHRRPAPRLPQNQSLRPPLAEAGLDHGRSGPGLAGILPGKPACMGRPEFRHDIHRGLADRTRLPRPPRRAQHPACPGHGARCVASTLGQPAGPGPQSALRPALSHLQRAQQRLGLRRPGRQLPGSHRRSDRRIVADLLIAPGFDPGSPRPRRRRHQRPLRRRRRGGGHGHGRRRQRARLHPEQSLHLLPL